MRMFSNVLVYWRSGLIVPLLFATVLVQVRAVVITPQNQGPFNDGLLDGSSVQSEMNADYTRGREGAVPQTQGWGWLGRWLSMGGEGSVVVHIGSNNISLPHRPAAFPSHIPSASSLPISGTLLPFTSLPSIPSSSSLPSLPSPSEHMISLGCLPPLSPVDRPSSKPKQPYNIALIERGGCDFATKVRSAQDRGAAAVIVGDTVAHLGEADEEGRQRESLITMFSPEDTTAIFIPSVFVSRASFLLLRDLLANHTVSDDDDRGRGLWLDVGEAADENGALTSLLSFALLMPSLFLLATIAIHRIRLARQREKDRAPPMVVLSLPERIWTPDIVWEKDDSGSERSVSVAVAIPSSPENDTSPNEINHAEGSTLPLPAPPPISSADIPTPPAVTVEDPIPPTTTTTGVTQTKSKRHVRKYFSKDECAICMDSFEKGDVVRILPCGHVFHKDECDEWLLKWRKLCPTCRADVTVPTSPRGGVSGTTLTPVTAPLLSDGEEDINENENTSGFGQSLRSLWGNIRRVFGQDQGGIRLEEEEVHARQGTVSGEEERAAVQNSTERV